MNNESEMPGYDKEVTKFFGEVNTIHAIVDKRRQDLEKQIQESKQQLQFLNELKAVPQWIYSYLQQETGLRDKVTKVLGCQDENHPTLQDIELQLKKVGEVFHCNLELPLVTLLAFIFTIS